ncbi:hypothetical protein PGTUg99_023537 [Puccinia graminis f. sp. tritici]|uniref:TAF6 C-terminal HEAT repeat domain-containing protein n=1 Tax=Puccinia graminis f. sp. tritici TaxID=56615 RepID=A0A5B0PPN2_PUCGR|nr:hypothetical protein PGTUg99_023537 [Puccinia graminis f. sp. tritici]
MNIRSSFELSDSLSVRVAELKSHPAFSGLQSSAIPSSSKQAPETKNLTTKEHLSRELRLYFDRVTAAALSNDQSSRNAALASLSGDPGLHQLVPYLIQFAAEKLNKLNDFLLPPVSEGRVLLPAPRKPVSLGNQNSEGRAIKPAPQRRAGVIAHPFWRGVGVGGRGGEGSAIIIARFMLVKDLASIVAVI